jgi:hypothetical protein
VIQNREPWPSCAVDADLTAHLADQGLADRQAQARAAIASADRAVGLAEALEQAGLDLGGDADAGVGDLEAQVARGRAGVSRRRRSPWR